MELYNVPRKSFIKVKGADGVIFFDDKPIFFINIDGMYSYCKDEDGNTIHIAAWTEVDIVDPPEGWIYD